jgi:hypothetical protein
VEISEALFICVVAAVADAGGNISEGAYDRIARAVAYFSPFEHLAIDSPELKARVFALLYERGREGSLKCALAVVPPWEESSLREFVYILATYFVHSELGPADRFDRYNQLTDVRDALGLRIGVSELSGSPFST